MNAIATTYEDTERMIGKICLSFARSYGGDFDDYLGPAHEAYMRAYRLWDKKKGAFTTYLWHAVTNELRSFVRRKARIACREVRADEKLYAETAGKTGFDFRLFLSELSDDAQTVVKLLVHTEQNITPTRVPKILRRLKKHLWMAGWSLKRIAESFKEVREALV